jgi:deoxyribodipyrimidine photolyase-related protein
MGELVVSTHASSTGYFSSSLLPYEDAPVDGWLWLSYDQLNLRFIEQVEPASGVYGIILIESSAKGNKRPYHKQKLALLLSSQRHFAIEVQATGRPVRYLMTNGTYEDALNEHVARYGPVEAIAHAELELRNELKPLIQNENVIIHEHVGWLTKTSWFEQSVGSQPPFRMDRFYRKVRHETGWLMEMGKPIGGKYSFDSENRFPWKGDPLPPEPPSYDSDEIDLEVEQLINTEYGSHPGVLDMTQLPTTMNDVETALAFGMKCMPWFGRYEDAMTDKSRGLFHSRLAALLNLHRLMPDELVQAVLETDAPLNSTEGFLRQLIWREYVHHIHEVTNGFRTLDVQRTPSNRTFSWTREVMPDAEEHPNHLRQMNPLPEVYWRGDSGLQCLDSSVKSVMEEGWTHHIPRLMVLSNIGNLLDVNPRELTDWFHAAFVDAYDWVVEPNVLGMGTFALGDAMMTKPYVAGSAYINRMSDHCKSCAFHPKKTCPITRLYWAYLDRHAPSFEGNFRMKMAMNNLKRRSEEEKTKDKLAFEWVSHALAQNEKLSI